MATILPFSEIKSHIGKNPLYKKAIIDTCALISYSHDTNEFNTEAFKLFEVLKQQKVTIYTNINIKSEFIEYQRRLIITEALTSIGQQIEGLFYHSEVAKRIKAHRTNVSKRATADNPLVLNDSSIKMFKKLLSFKHRSSENVWLTFCRDNLSGTLEKTFNIIERVLKLKYLSMRSGEQSQEINSAVSWQDMYNISEESGLGISDAMILNIFYSTTIPILVTTDFDLVYAGSISNNSKLIFCPDRMLTNLFKDRDSF